MYAQNSTITIKTLRRIVYYVFSAKSITTSNKNKLKVITENQSVFAESFYASTVNLQLAYRRGY